MVYCEKSKPVCPPYTPWPPSPGALGAENPLSYSRMSSELYPGPIHPALHTTVWSCKLWTPTGDSRLLFGWSPALRAGNPSQCLFFFLPGGARSGFARNPEKILKTTPQGWAPLAPLWVCGGGASPGNINTVRQFATRSLQNQDHGNRTGVQCTMPCIAFEENVAVPCLVHHNMHLGATSEFRIEAR